MSLRGSALLLVLHSLNCLTMAPLTTNLHSQKCILCRDLGRLVHRSKSLRLVSSGVEGPDVVVALHMLVAQERASSYLLLCV